MKIVLLGTLVSSVFNFRVGLIDSLLKKNFSVYVFCVDFDEESRNRIRKMGAIPIDYSLRRAGINPFKDLVDTFWLIKKFREISPDVVFSYFVKPVIFGTLAAKFAGVPRKVGMLEGLGYVFTNLPEGVGAKQNFLRKVQVFLYRIALPMLDRLIFLNPDDSNDLVEKNNLKISDVSILGGIGVDLNKYCYKRNDNKSIVFIFVGRLLAEKGIREYIKASQLIAESYPGTRCIVLGGIDEENPGGLSKVELDELITSGIVEYPGYVNSVVEWLEASSVFVLPSYREGVPCSTQEAMAIGCAVITTDVPGCRETVIDGVNGYIVPPWNAEALAEKMLYLLANPELVSKMGLESRKIAEKCFDQRIVNERLVKMIIS